MRLRRGFTLIELLLAVGIMSVLAAMVIFALNPTKQLGTSRNAQRQSDVNAILNAVYQYQIDTNQMPAGITTTPREICKTGAVSCNNGVDLSVLTASGVYLVRIPADLQNNQTGTGTHYTVKLDNNSRITVAAPYAEEGETISVTR